MNFLYLVAFNLGDAFFPQGDTFPKTETEVGSLVSAIVKTSLSIAGVVVVILIVLAGIAVISGGSTSDPRKAESGKKYATSAVIGFMIIFCSYWIVRILEIVLGLEIL